MITIAIKRWRIQDIHRLLGVTSSAPQSRKSNRIGTHSVFYIVYSDEIVAN